MASLTRYWVSSSFATCQVNVGEDGRIVHICPIWERFRGQPLGNLLGWLRPYGLRMEKL